MNTKQVMSIGAALALTGSLGVGVSYGADEKSSSGGSDNRPSAFGRVGNQGEGFTEDQAVKGRGQLPDSTPGQDAQITLGGARPVVEGPILKVQGDDYIIRDSSGTEVRVRVNKDTNMDCASGTGQASSMSTGRQADDQREIPPTSHMQESMSSGQSSGQQSGRSQEQIGKDIVQKQGHTQQQASAGGERVGDQSGTQSRSAMGKDPGGDIARGSGFTIGQKGSCAFKAGDKVRAEVSDLGTVLYVKYLSEQEMGSHQRMSGQMIPQSEPMTKGELESAQQRAQLMKPGSVPAAGDLQNPDATTRPKQTAKAQSENVCEGCKVVRGLVLSSDSKSLLVRDSSQNEVRLKVDQSTHMGNFSQPRAATFMEGDRVEAYVKPDGIAWSIIGMKQQQGQPGVAGAPGD
ncbi:MAG TPA: hypothetical protein VJV04_09350 [Nitrospiraceae bacterium]|nr:hypothetical protein [Nitrospiraceae bacterium]